MKSRVIERYIESAIRFSPEHAHCGGGRVIRVANTLMTCGAAAAAFNEMHMSPERESVYRYINVHNPRCPFMFDRDQRQWSCAPDFEDHPACGINWAGALLVCRHMGARLPLAHEWECFASNNEPSREYPWGNAEPSYLLANYDEHFGGTSMVCNFPPSEIGLYDLAGNLGEWCHDHCEAVDERGVFFERVVKGGAWSKGARYLRITTSRGKWERLGTTTIGFRPVWDD